MLNRRLRVLHVVKSLGRGGAERVVLDLARYGNALGHRHEVLVAMREPLDMLCDFEAHGIRPRLARYASLPALLSLGSYVKQIVAHEGIDVVHGHFPFTSALVRGAVSRSSAAYVFTHHVNHSDFRFGTRVLNRLTWHNVDVNVSVSPNVNQDVVRHLGGRVPSTTIMNGIDTAWFGRRQSQANRRIEMNLPSSTPVVGLVASMRPQKRVDRWVEVASLIAERHNDVNFLVVGGGSEEHLMQQMVRDANLEARFRFVGPAVDVRPWLEAMDIFLMTSDYEGFGLVAVEAMAIGVVPVVTAVGPLPDIVQPAWGLSVAPHVSLLADAVSEILVDTDRRNAMAAKGIAVAREHYDVKRMVEEYHAVYRGVSIDRK